MKNILITVTGGIAIYKTLTLIRILKEKGYKVKCIMTKAATQMIRPVMFETLSGNTVRYETFPAENNHEIEHISFSRWADLVIVAPATANIISKIANGIADDFVSTTLMASNKPIMVAPTMNTEMWNSPAFQRNLKQITLDGKIIIEPTSGKLACDECGTGRMEEPEKIFEHIEKFFK